MNRFPSLIVLT